MNFILKACRIPAVLKHPRPSGCGTARGRYPASLIVLWLEIAIILLIFVYGNTFARQDYPQKIISLGPSITKALYLLDAQDKLIANTVYCSYPPAAKDKEKIGTVLEINVEKIFNLKPDIVLATSLTSPKAKEKLQNLGVRIIMLPAPKDFPGLCSQFLELGRIIDKESRAEQIIKATKGRVASIKKKVENLPRPKVLVQVGAKPLVAAGGSYFVNDYIESGGGINIAKDALDGIYSKEQIVNDNPDVIIISRMGIASELEKKNWQDFETLNAVKSGRIYILDSEELTSPTPESFADTLEEIARILHPEIENGK